MFACPFLLVSAHPRDICRFVWATDRARRDPDARRGAIIHDRSPFSPPVSPTTACPRIVATAATPGRASSHRGPRGPCRARRFGPAHARSFFSVAPWPGHRSLHGGVYMHCTTCPRRGRRRPCDVASEREGAPVQVGRRTAPRSACNPRRDSVVGGPGRHAYGGGRVEGAPGSTPASEELGGDRDDVAVELVDAWPWSGRRDANEIGISRVCRRRTMRRDADLIAPLPCGDHPRQPS